MEPLPQPPAAFDPPISLPARPQRPGELAVAWRVAYGVAWIGVVLGLAAVWRSSRTLGLPTWWLGPEAGPRPILVQLLPFLPPIALILAAIRSVRWLPWWGLAGAAAVGAMGAADLGRYSGLALVQVALAAAGALVSLAAVAGMLRAHQR